IVGLTAGGPGTSTRTLSYQIYEDAFTYMKFSIASAEGVLLTIMIVAINTALNKVRDVWGK
ncbi:MAG: sugar ABC transporter permease, partial [Bullifex sp.]|nr:sugar ABC transporter permease [Bullifex sp.]